MNSVIFDCDPGHDDIIAIMVALAHPESFRILGATTVAGNQTIEKVTSNLLRVQTLLGVDFPVARGCSRPLRRAAEPQPAGHGETGLDGPVLPEADRSVVSQGAVEFLYNSLMQSEQRVIIFALGPLTNIACLLIEHPEAAAKIEKLELMGGSLYSGNIIPRAEFNIYHDPEAARLVFESGIPIVMSGLEVCSAGSIINSEYEPLKNGGRASRLAFDLLEFFSQYGRRRGMDSSPIFDMTPVIHTLMPELFTSKHYHIDIETEGRLCRGMTVADFSPFRDRSLDVTEVLTGVKRSEFIEVLLSSLSRLDSLLK